MVIYLDVLFGAPAPPAGAPLPAAGRASPMSSRRSELLPLPLPPIITNTSPRRTLKVNCC